MPHPLIIKPLTIKNPDGSIEVLYAPHPKQAEFHARTEPNVLFVGSRGTGKSLALRWEAHIRALSTPNFTYIILRRTYPELQKSHINFISAEMKKLGGYYHHTDKIAYYPNGSKGFFSHCQSEEDVLNLLSAQFAWMGFDEISTFEWDMVIKLAASVRVPVDSGLVAMVRACTNPLGVSADKVNKYYVTKDVDPEEDPEYVPEDWYFIKATLKDNPSIDEEQYRKRFSGMPTHVRKAWLDGDFVLENALFDFYPTMNGKPYHVLPDIDLPKLVKAAQIYRAYDHGYFPDPAICLWFAHLGNRYVVFHEKLWYKTVASDIAADILEETKLLGISRIWSTYCDPTIDIHTGADIRTIKDTFEISGVPMECSINNREFYAASIHSALAEEVDEGVPRLQIYNNGRRGCAYLVKTLPQQRFDPKRPLKLADHPDDHAVVTLAYFLISSGSMERRAATAPAVTRPWMKDSAKFEGWVLGKENVKDS